MAKQKEEVNPDPRPKREDFDRVLKNLLNAPPITREEVHTEGRKKRKKKLSKVIDADTISRS
jgi:hypothetical protein